jgi:hypothetical protein
MKSNIKSQALLSLNPTFNMDFLSTQIFEKYPTNEYRTPHRKIKEVFPTVEPKDKRKSEPTLLTTFFEKERGEKERTQVGQLRGKSLSFRKLESLNPNR